MLVFYYVPSFIYVYTIYVYTLYMYIVIATKLVTYASMIEREKKITNINPG